MGLSFTKLFGLFFPKQEIQIVMMGLGAAGKTTILYKLKLGQVVSTDITVGFNVEMVEYKNIDFSFMDVGGQSRAWVSQECNDGQVKTRPLWSIYFRKTPCLIFVIDSNDRERVDDARNELHLTLQKGELSDAVLLVFANKQDLPNAMSTTEITDKLGLNSLGQQRWHIQGTSAISGEGLQEGLDWICTTVLGEGEQAHEQK